MLEKKGTLQEKKRPGKPLSKRKREGKCLKGVRFLLTGKRSGEEKEEGFRGEGPVFKKKRKNLRGELVKDSYEKEVKFAHKREKGVLKTRRKESHSAAAIFKYALLTERSL